MWKEFKEFATKGNVIDLAIGVIIGGGFQKIVNSLVNDLIMPTVSIFTGKIDFNDMILQIGNTSIRYGSFLTNVINFLIIAFFVFLLVRYVNKLNKKLEKKHIFSRHKTKTQNSPAIPTTKTCPYCLSQIPMQATKCAHCTSSLEETLAPKEE